MPRQRKKHSNRAGEKQTGTITSIKLERGTAKMTFVGEEGAIHLSAQIVTRSGFELESLRRGDTVVVDYATTEKGTAVTWIYTVNAKDREQFNKAPRRKSKLSLPMQRKLQPKKAEQTSKKSRVLEEGTDAVGVIISYYIKKGFGFIRVEGPGSENLENYFFHFRDVTGFPKSELQEGNRVRFTAKFSSEGKPRAEIYALLSEAKSDN